MRLEALNSLAASVGRSYSDKDKKVVDVCVALCAALAAIETPNAMTLNNLQLLEQLAADSKS
jgi:hypothetical protein